jgi:uncharacterized protein (DUF2141 family)
MKAPLTGALALAAAISLGGQSTILPILQPPTTAPVGQAKPPQKPLPTQTSKAISSGELSGRVVDDGNRAVVDAAVWLVGAASLYRAATDSRGRFVFPTVATGDYVVVARKAGFYDGAYGKRRANGLPVPLSFVPGQALSDVQIELFRAGVITGSIVDDGLEPVVGARVLAIRRFFAGAEWQYVEAGTALTDDQGAYRIYGLPPGEYLVMTPTTQMNTEIPEQRLIAAGIPNMDERDLAYPTLFYAASRFSELALTVQLSSGEVRYAVNFQWSPVPARSVSGVLIGTRVAVADQIVRLVQFETHGISPGHEIAATTSAVDGTFRFERVPAGEYRIEAGGAFGTPRLVDILAESSSPAPSVYWGDIPVRVIDEDVERLAIEMQSGRRVSGVIRAPAGTPSERISIVIVPSQPGLSRTIAPAVANGRFFTAPLVPGLYDIRVSGLPAGRYLKDITVDGITALDSPAELGVFEDTEIVISVTDKPTLIEGAVRNANQVLSSGATVVVMPLASSEWNPNRSRVTRASMNGLFAVAGLPAGEYLIVAFDDAAGEGLQDERVLRQLQTLATRVSLREGESKALQMRLSVVRR